MPLDEATLNEMAAHYNLLWPQYPPLQVAKGWILSVWMVGNNYQNRNPLYGTYPPNILERLLSIFPDYDPKTTLHIFSGAVPKDKGLRLDLSPTFDPDYVGNAEELSTLFPTKRFQLIVADPPYDRTDAEKYGFPYPNKKRVVSECYKVLEPGGYLAFFDTRMPMWRKTEFNCFGTIAVIQGSNHRVRLWTLYQRVV